MTNGTDEAATKAIRAAREVVDGLCAHPEVWLTHGLPGEAKLALIEQAIARAIDQASLGTAGVPEWATKLFDFLTTEYYDAEAAALQGSPWSSEARPHIEALAEFISAAPKATVCSCPEGTCEGEWTCRGVYAAHSDRLTPSEPTETIVERVRTQITDFDVFKVSGVQNAQLRKDMLELCYRAQPPAPSSPPPQGIDLEKCRELADELEGDRGRAFAVRKPTAQSIRDLCAMVERERHALEVALVTKNLEIGELRRAALNPSKDTKHGG